MRSLRRFSLSAVLAACLALQPTPAAALHVIIPTPPPTAWDRVVTALSDATLDGGDLADAAFDEFWRAAGDAIAQTQICREAYARFHSNPNNAAFTFTITVTAQGDPPVTYAQPIRVVPQPNGTLVVGVAKGNGGYARIFRCGGDGAAQPQQEDPAAATIFAEDGWTVGAGSVPSSEATHETRGGVGILTFDTEQGNVVVYLPDDMAPGDTISGSVYVEPNGQNDAERAANAATLRGYGVDVPGARVRAADRLLRFVVPAASSVLAVVVSDRAGRSVGVTSVPMALPSTVPTDMIIPAVTQAGRPATIAGPFDGDAANTQVAVNGAPCPILAESPRQVVLSTPDAPTGPINVRVRDGSHSAQGVANNIGVQLSAERLTLARGERTTVRLHVVGLEGIETPLQVRVWASSTVNLQGGNIQFVTINPNAINAAGEFAQQFNLRVLAPGPFDVTAGLYGILCSASVESEAARQYRRALRNVRSAHQRADDAMRELTAAEEALKDAEGDYGEAHFDYLTAVYANRNNPSAANASAVDQAWDARQRARRPLEQARAAVAQAQERYRTARREAGEASANFRDAIGHASAEERAAVDASEQRCAGTGR